MISSNLSFLGLFPYEYPWWFDLNFVILSYHRGLPTIHSLYRFPLILKSISPINLINLLHNTIHLHHALVSGSHLVGFDAFSVGDFSKSLEVSQVFHQRLSVDRVEGLQVLFCRKDFLLLELHIALLPFKFNLT